MTRKFAADAAKVPSTTKRDPDACPLCGSKVLYRGLTDIECAGAPLTEVPEHTDYTKSPVPIPAIPAKPACPNYREQPFNLQLDISIPIMWFV